MKFPWLIDLLSKYHNSFEEEHLKYAINRFMKIMISRKRISEKLRE
jgi:hypothetical protein